MDQNGSFDLLRGLGGGLIVLVALALIANLILLQTTDKGFGLGVLRDNAIQQAKVQAGLPLGPPISTAPK